MLSIKQYHYNLKFLFAAIIAIPLLFTACGDDNPVDPDPPEPGAPSIESINPDSGPVGTEVIIYGSNFSATPDDNAVTFNGTAATVTSASADSLVTTVPEGATSGPVEVTVNGETATGPDFTVAVAENPPTISSVDPLSGPIGTEVTITGTNFSATPEENTVTFGGVEATINSATETELVVVVPEGANSGPVEVTVNGLAVTSASDFEVSVDNMMQAIAADGDLSSLAELLRGTDLETTLGGSSAYTILAPTNAALDSLTTAGFFDGLSQQELTEVLSYYVIEGNRTIADLEAEGEVETLNGDAVYMVGNGTINNKFSIVTAADIEAPNGRIHKITQPLIPDAYLDVFDITYKRPVTNKFACHCISDRTNLDEVLHNEANEYIVFAPSTQAFNNRPTAVDSLSDAELQQLMNNHIVENQGSQLTNGQTLDTRSGMQLTITIAGDGTISVSNGSNTATAIIEDLEGTNGVVYVIDGILESPSGGGGT